VHVGDNIHGTRDVNVADCSSEIPAEVDHSRRKFLTRATMAMGAVGSIFAAVPFIESWLPSERARANTLRARRPDLFVTIGICTQRGYSESPLSARFARSAG